MKKLAILFIAAGFALSTSVVTAGDNNKSCDKDKKACCKKGEGKSCSKAEGKSCHKDGEKAGQDAPKK
jgi:hypothetical protein